MTQYQKYIIYKILRHTKKEKQTNKSTCSWKFTLNTSILPESKGGYSEVAKAVDRNRKDIAEFLSDLLLNVDYINSNLVYY